MTDWGNHSSYLMRGATPDVNAVLSVYGSMAAPICGLRDGEPPQTRLFQSSGNPAIRPCQADTFKGSLYGNVRPYDPLKPQYSALLL